jgi:hypothetical protein
MRGDERERRLGDSRGRGKGRKRVIMANTAYLVQCTLGSIHR